MSFHAIEEESGTYTGPTRRHNGYWAGDHSRSTDSAVLARWFVWGQSQPSSACRHITMSPSSTGNTTTGTIHRRADMPGALSGSGIAIASHASASPATRHRH